MRQIFKLFLLLPFTVAYAHSGFSIPDNYSPNVKDCYNYSRAFQYYNIAKRTKQSLRSVSRHIRENYFSDNREVYHFFLQPDLSRYHKRYNFIVEPMNRYKKCIVEIKYSEYTLESCFKMMYLKDLIWAYRNAKTKDSKIQDILRDQLGRAYYFAEVQINRFLHIPRKKFKRYMRKDFEQCLVNRKEKDLSGEVVKIKSGDTLVVENDGETFEISFMGMRAPKKAEIDVKAVAHLKKLVLHKQVKVKYHEAKNSKLVGYVEYNGKAVGESMIREGLCEYQKKDFDSSYFIIKDSYARASANAKLKKVGIWSKKKKR